MRTERRRRAEVTTGSSTASFFGRLDARRDVEGTFSRDSGAAIDAARTISRRFDVAIDAGRLP